jgi:hypothetical protein
VNVACIDDQKLMKAPACNGNRHYSGRDSLMEC